MEIDSVRMKRTKLSFSTFCFHSNNKWGVKIVANIKKNSVVENLCKIEMKKEQFFFDNDWAN